MVKIAFGLVALLAVSGFLLTQGGSHWDSRRLSAEIIPLLREYGVEVSHASCGMMGSTSAGFCQFQVPQEKVMALVVMFESGPKQTQKIPHVELYRSKGGVEECLRYFRRRGVREHGVTPRSQRGGGKLPYLVGVYIDERSGDVCVDLDTDG